MWIARSDDGTLFLFNSKPSRIKRDWCVNDDEIDYNCNSFNVDYGYEINERLYSQFKDLTWADEPIEIIINKK